MPHVRRSDVVTIDVKKSPSRGGVIIRDNATRESVFVEYEQLMTVALKLIDERDKERQLRGRNAR